MKKILLIYYLIFTFLTSSCGLIWTFKILDSYEEENIAEHSFREEIDFQIIKGFIVVEVELEDDKKKFIIDTGASSVLDDDYATSLVTKKIGKRKTVDSNGKKDFVPYVKLDHFNIGELTFKNAVASISDLSKLSEVSGIEVSGIVGANAMNKSIWQIDFEARKIVITSHMDSLQLPSETPKINFSATGKGTPTISIYTNGQFCGEAIFDTGSNGGIDLNAKYLSDSISFEETESILVGLNSEKKRTIKDATVPSLSLSKYYTLENQPVSFFDDARFGIIGTKFLKDYRVTIDWKYQNIYLEKY